MTKYSNDIETWESTTENLIKELPIDTQKLVDIVLDAMEKVLDTKIGNMSELTVQKMQPSPQTIGNYLHAVMPHLLKMKDNNWRPEENKNDKDIVYIPNDNFSLELKTSSNKDKIFANRSYAQPSTDGALKNKDGYYLAVNFEKFKKNDPEYRPKISLIRIGYLNHSDWIAQKSPTGQQASLSKEANKRKFKTIYKKES